METGKHSYLLGLQIVEGSKANGETSCFIRLTKYPNKNKKLPWTCISDEGGEKETGLTILVGKSLCMWASNRTNEILGRTDDTFFPSYFNPLNPKLNPICYLLPLLGAHHFLHVSRIMVKLLTFRRLMSYIWSTHSWCF